MLRTFCGKIHPFFTIFFAGLMNGFPISSLYLFLEDYEYKLGAGSNCSKPCAFMGVFFGIPIKSKNDPDEAYIKFYFKTQINVRVSHLAYTGLSLFGELGGYVGLLLGISCMDFTTLIHKMIQYLSPRLCK